MFHRKKNKSVDLDLCDSNYQPAPNPNSLEPQAATGARPVPPTQPQALPPRGYPPQHLPRPIPTAPPTVINNYYYVTPDGRPYSPQQQQQRQQQQRDLQLQKRREKQKRELQRQQQQQHQQQDGLGEQQRQLDEQRIRQQQELQRRQEQEQQRQRLQRQQRQQRQQQQQRQPEPIASRMPSMSRSSFDLDSDPQVDIYSPSSLYVRRQLAQKSSMALPDTPPLNRHSPNSRSPNIYFADTTVCRDLIGLLEPLDAGAITVHNTQLYDLFNSFDKDILGADDLRDALIDPGTRRRFSRSTCSILAKVFSSRNAPEKLDFRSFVRLCSFLKGSLDSFNYYDADSSLRLEEDEFEEALRFNGMRCSSDLMDRFFRDSDYVSFEGFVIAIIQIRRNEHRRH